MRQTASIFVGITGKLITPDGTEYKLSNASLRITRDLVEVPVGPEPHSPLVHVHQADMNFDFTGKWNTDGQET